MIITRERLTELAREEAKRRAANGRLVTAYLVGSVAYGEPLYAGCTDVDVILVYSSPPIQTREILPLSPDVHLDLYHREQQEFEPPRELRTDPDLGPSLYHAVRLHDPDHFFDWIQAAACAQFDRPDNQLARSFAHLQRARSIRKDLDAGLRWTHSYLQAALDGANAVASLVGRPAYGRRIVRGLRAAFADLDRLDLFAHFQHLYGADRVQDWRLADWLAGWAKGYDHTLKSMGGSHLHAVRRDYFLRAFQLMAEADEPEAVVLPLLQNWAALAAPQSEDGKLAQEMEHAWAGLLRATGLAAENRKQRKDDLEAFLDSIERYLVQWGEDHGA